MIILLHPLEQVNPPFILVVTRNNGMVDKLYVASIEHAEDLADTPPGFKAASLWKNIKGKGLTLIGINK